MKELTGTVEKAADGLWFHPDDPSEHPFIIRGKDGKPLSLEGQHHYTGSHTAEMAELVFAEPTPAEEQRVEEFLEQHTCEDDIESLAEEWDLQADGKLVLDGLVRMIVRGKLEECHWTNICLLLQLAEDAGFERLTRDNPRDRRMVEAAVRLDGPAGQ